MTEILFAELLEPRLNKPKDEKGGTYWKELEDLVRNYNSCASHWIELSTRDIRRKRQLDKFEPVITYYILAALYLATDGFKDVGQLKALFKKAFDEPSIADQVASLLRNKGWKGLEFEALMTPTEKIKQAVANKVRECPILYARQIAQSKPGVRFESPTHLDIFVGDPEGLTRGSNEFALGIEAKFTSDIDNHTTYLTHRNQIIRNIEVGNNRFSSFAFLLITPRTYRQWKSRFYVYKMSEYLGRDGVRSIRQDSLVDPGENAREWKRRIGWLDWEDFISAIFPNGKSLLNHNDADRLIEVLKDRCLWPWREKD